MTADPAFESAASHTGAPGAYTPRRRRVWPWVLGTVLLMLLLVSVAAAALLLNLADWAGDARDGVSIVIDGERWEPGLHIDGPAWQWVVGLAAGIAVCLLALLVVVPAALALAVLAAAAGLGVALLAVVLSLAGVMALVLSPLWLLLWLVWMARRKPAKAGPATATMAG